MLEASFKPAHVRPIDPRIDRERFLRHSARNANLSYVNRDGFPRIHTPAEQADDC